MTLPLGKKKRGRSSPAKDHGADDGNSSSQPTNRQRLTSNRNPKNLQPSPVSASASPTPSGSPTQQDSEETPIGPPATSEDPPPAKSQNLPRSNQQSLSRSSSKGVTPSSEQGDNEEDGMGKEMDGGAIKPHRFYFQPAEYGKSLLKENFRENVEEFDDSCPRMCKSRFLGNGSSGYALSEIYEKLGETKDISNILKPIGSESDLLVEIFDDGLWDDLELVDDGDRNDPIVNGWNKIIIHDQVKILWEDLYKMDVKTREKEHELERICKEPEGPRVCEETEARCHESLETRVDADKEATKDGENEHEKECDGENDPEKEGQVDADKEATKDGENESEKEATKKVENEPEQTVQEDLEVMTAAAEKLEKEDKKASEKEPVDEMDEDAEEDSPKKTKRRSKPSRMKQSPYVEK
ncbi:hypothetical protein Bca52824_011053 [Brassica carinata]|uniref:DUF287 domain-containing protein n=1 Tax=Brassica carinata TaxID=52824 RepID=A0A8X7WFJ5_BRACI|nr:hypothetical protein Bca52824_011053 [Brassica carinata]